MLFLLICYLSGCKLLLCQATSQLVNAIKCQAETHPDSEMQRKLMAAAKMLADATASMVEAAKVGAPPLTATHCPPLTHHSPTKSPQYFSFVFSKCK